jgi:hypothetical protein
MWAVDRMEAGVASRQKILCCKSRNQETPNDLSGGLTPGGPPWSTYVPTFSLLLVSKNLARGAKVSAKTKSQKSPPFFWRQ